MRRFAVLVAAMTCAGPVATAALQVSAQQPAAAQGAESSEIGGEPAGYRTLVADALSEYEAGHFEESRALMLRAHQRYPNARTLRGLGMVSFELREYAVSVRQLEDALSSQERPLQGDLRAETIRLLERARSFAGRLAIALRPRTARVFLDGVELVPSTARDLLLSVGEHVLEIRADGYMAERRMVRIAGGERAVVRISLTPLATAAREDSSTGEAWYENPWVWVSAGVLAAAGAATVLIVGGDGPAREQPYSGLSGEPPLVGPRGP